LRKKVPGVCSAIAPKRKGEGKGGRLNVQSKEGIEDSSRSHSWDNRKITKGRPKKPRITERKSRGGKKSWSKTYGWQEGGFVANRGTKRVTED